eukprot:CAMPEP_0113534580 /NCGR_PEP_ID=MMETSP0015_2-20120614/5234_1 /TAXON_ID=2838 /ORGANISM="Odontella" /LENGTH=809 /DNA_ID=CAMNT_0000433749 /DNA_START=74 /DNA_END=2504 /DNA_ORIENTATION=+ /assembly_acc=CAM_ASM_000160
MARGMFNYGRAGELQRRAGGYISHRGCGSSCFVVLTLLGYHGAYRMAKLRPDGQGGQTTVNRKGRGSVAAAGGGRWLQQRRSLVGSNDTRTDDTGLRIRSVALDLADMETANNHRCRYTTQWSNFFDKAAGDERRGDEQAEGPIPVDKQKYLDPEILDNIRKMFRLYFEGSHHSTSEVEKDNKGGNDKYSSLFSAIDGTMPWLQGFITEANIPFSKSVLFVELCLRGIGQVYFQNNPISGLFILIGLFVQSSRVAVHGIIAVVSSNLFAFSLGFDKGLRRSGLFGYNALLVGLALASFYSREKNIGYSIAVAVCTVIFSCFSSILFVMLGKLLVPYKSPPLTLPFNMATIMYLLSTANMAKVNSSSVRESMLPVYNSTEVDTTISTAQFFIGAIRGPGQVFLANNVVSGLLILVGIAICSRISALAALVGSALGAAVAVAAGVPGTAVEFGMYGFNCSLTTTALFMLYIPSWGALTLGVLAGIMTVLAQQALTAFLQPFGLPFMTLPFCMASLPFVIIQGTTSLVIAVPLSTVTAPEDHLRKVKYLKDGFLFLKEALLEPGNVNAPNRPTYGKKLTKSLKLVSSVLEEDVMVEDCELDMSRKSTMSRVPSAGRSATVKAKRWSLKKRYAHKDSWVLEAAPAIFAALLSAGSEVICLQDFVGALQAAGLTEKRGLGFATLVFNLVDINNRSYLDMNEFVILALLSRALVEVQKRLAKFFDFVSLCGESINFDEIDSALDYLGEPGLTKSERDALLAAIGVDRDDGGMNVTEIINFVTVAKIKAMVSEHQRGDVGNDLSLRSYPSLHSAPL